MHDNSDNDRSRCSLLITVVDSVNPIPGCFVTGGLFSLSLSLSLLGSWVWLQVPGRFEDLIHLHL